MKKDLTDTHCHLDDKRYEHDLKTVISKENSPEFILVPGCTIESSARAVEIADEYPSVYAAVGVHPTELENWGPEEIESLKELAKSSKVLAIGEVGLDYHYPDNPSKEYQKQVFIDQIQLAGELSLPFIVHARDSVEDAIEIVEKYAKTPCVFHAFSGTIDQAKRILEQGNYISVGGVVTFKNAGKLVKITEMIPLDRLLIETDGPYLTPVPFRGKRNEPAYTNFVVEKIAQIRNESPDKILSSTADNAKRFFGVDF